MNIPDRTGVVRTAVDSPVGRLVVEAEGGAIVRIGWSEAPSLPSGSAASNLLAEAARQLDAYFAGQLEAFDLPLAPVGSPFEHAVWRAMLAIPYGETRTYGEIARDVGGASPRAVGSACGANPIPIVIPCHRVVGANGRLTGYSGQGGVETKRRLLALEQPTLF